MAEQQFSKQILDPGYGPDHVDRHDFVCKGELTVRITLNEYRALVQQQGAYEKKLKEKEDRNSELWSENARLKQTIETLRQGLEGESEE